jgi:hypothetical protein
MPKLHRNNYLLGIGLFFVSYFDIFGLFLGSVLNNFAIVLKLNFKIRLYIYIRVNS